jgi:hypothetical protein
VRPERGDEQSHELGLPAAFRLLEYPLDMRSCGLDRNPETIGEFFGRLAVKQGASNLCLSRRQRKNGTDPGGGDVDVSRGVRDEQHYLAAPGSGKPRGWYWIKTEHVGSQAGRPRDDHVHGRTRPADFDDLSSQALVRLGARELELATVTPNPIA